MSLLGDVASVGALIYGGIKDERNYQLEKENLDYQKEIQEKIFAREDNAVQRRVNDLRAAGLSPTLAAGSAAGAGSVVSTKAPSFDAGNMMKAIEASRALQQNALTKAQINLVNTQNANEDAKGFFDRLLQHEFVRDATNEGRKSYDFLQESMGAMIQEQKARRRKAEEEIRNTDIARNLGIRSDVQGISAQLAQGLSAVPQLPGKALDAFESAIQSLLNKAFSEGSPIGDAVRKRGM